MTEIHVLYERKFILKIKLTLCLLAVSFCLYDSPVSTQFINPDSVYQAEIEKIDLRSTRQVVAEVSELYGIDSLLAFAIVTVESGWDTMAVSSEGCKGLWQLHEKYFIVEDIFNVEVNTNWGAAYLRQLIDDYGDTLKALTAYNFGPSHYQTQLGTSAYADKIMRFYYSLCKERGKRTLNPKIDLQDCPITISL